MEKNDDHKLANQQYDVPELKEEMNILGRISKFFIERHRIVFLLIIAVLVWGLVSFINLKRELQPEITLPYGFVTIPYIGAAPEEIENLITDKVEKKIDEMEDITRLNSYSSYGVSSIWIEFEQGVDIDKKIDKLREVISDIKPSLPNDIEDPMVSKLETNNAPIMIINVSGEYRNIEITNFAKDIKDEIEKINGILEVDVIGGLEREIRIIIDPQKLSQYNITTEQIKSAIEYSNINFPGGDIEIDNKNYNIRTVGEFTDSEELKNIVVTYVDNNPLLLGSIATIYDGYKERETYSRTSFGLDTDSPSMKNSVALSIKKKNNADVISVSSKVHELIMEKEGTLYPKDLQVSVSGDTSVYVEDQLGAVVNNAKSGLLLVLLVLFLFIGFKEAAIVSFVIPIAIFASFGLMKNNGMTFNTITLFSLVLAVGLLVDNAIVIMENVVRLRDKGLNAKLAAQVGTNQIAPAIAASTLTTIAAFYPMLLTGGIMGEFIKGIPITVMFALSASLLAAVLITPALCSVFLRRKTVTKVPNPKKDKFRKIISIVFVALLALYAFSDSETGIGFLSIFFAIVFSASMFVKQFKKKERKEGEGFHIIEVYGDYLFKIIQSKKRMTMVVGGVIIAFILSMSLIPLGLLKVEMFGASDYSRLYIDINTPVGSNVETTSQISRKIEEKLLNYPEIEGFTANIGTSGADSFNDFEESSGSNPTYARITIDLVDEKDREKSSMELSKMIQEDVKMISGADIYVVELEDGPPSSSPITIKLRGRNMESLRSTVNDFKNILSEISGTRSVKTSANGTSPELQIKVNKQKAMYLGLNDMMVASTIRNAVNGVATSKFRNNQDDIDIIIKTSDKKLNNKQDIENLYFYTQQGNQVPFNAIAEIVETKSVATIVHEDLKRQVTVSSDVNTGVIPLDVLNEFKAKISSYSLPEDVEIYYGGEFEDLNESFSDMLINMLIAAILVYSILAIQFNSLSQPMIILLSVPMALIGVMPGLVLTGNTFGFVSFIGVVALVGIAVNDAIVLIDYINYLRKNGKDLLEAVKETGMTRFVPVFATSITTIGGILPITLKNSFFAPMGFSLIFGLVMATVLTLVVVPVVYTLLEKYKIKRKEKKIKKQEKNIMEGIKIEKNNRSIIDA